MNMPKRILLLSWVLTTAVSGCAVKSPKALIDQPLPSSPRAPRELTLKYYTLSLFEEYRVSHAYLDGVNISVCYNGAEPSNVQFTTVRYTSGAANTPRLPVPGYILNRHDYQPPHPGRSAASQLLGTKRRNAYFGYDFMTFDEFCGDWTAGGAVTLGIRDRRAESIEQLVLFKETWTRNYNARKIAEGTHFRAFLEPTEYVVRNGNRWVHLRERSPTVPGMDENDTWLLPVGNSNYYFYLAFGHMYQARINQNAEYMKVQNLVDRIIDSFVVEKLEAEK